MVTLKNEKKYISFQVMPRTLETDLVKIGKRLKEMRIAKGYSSYRNFANEHDIEPKSYWRLEQGVSDFKLSSLKRVLDAYGLNIEDFFREL